MAEALARLGTAAVLGLEAVAALLVVVGGVEALYGILRGAVAGPSGIRNRKNVWVSFGAWLLLGLEFELAGDIVRSVISETWADIGRLAAIAVIRTFLNYFLEQDVEKYAAARRPAPGVTAEERPTPDHA